jgi:major membrane immunogen (membrane-anchored lipoprotein)
MAFAAGPWQDGTYTAQGDAFDHGWKNMVQITVMNGYITAVHFDAIPEEDGGKYKYVASVQGDYGMLENSDAQAAWYAQADRAEARLIEWQDPASFQSSGGADAVSGVSVTIAPFFELAQEALSGARR